MLYKNTELLGDALKRYYLMNGLPIDGGIHDRWARYKFGPIHAVAFPNFKHRKEAIIRHDIHHILNNLDTSPLGEGLIAAWELGSGCGKYWISWFMESQALWWGILLAPKSALAQFVLGRKSRNYFKTEMESDLKKQTVGNIRLKMIPLTINPMISIKECTLFILFAFLGIFCLFLFIPIATIFTIFSPLLIKIR